MTAPISTSLHSTRPVALEITDPQVAALFVKDHISSYLAQFIGAEVTVNRAALQIGAKLNVMAYWAARFVKFGLIHVTRVETRGGSAIKHYRAVADEFVVPIALLEGLTTTEVLQRVMRRDYDRFSRSVSAAGLRLTPDWHLRLYRDDWGHGTPLEPSTAPEVPAPRPLHDFAYVTLPPKQAREFHRELADLFERFKAAGQHQPGLPRFLMHVGFAEDAG